MGRPARPRGGGSQRRAGGGRGGGRRPTSRRTGRDRSLTRPATSLPLSRVVAPPRPWHHTGAFEAEETIHEHAGIRVQRPKRSARGRSQARRAEREGALRRRLGALGAVQARPQSHHRRRPHRALSIRSAQGSHRARARQRGDARRDQRGHHAHGVLRGLADGHDGRAHRERRLRGEKVMRVGFIGLGLMGNHMATNVQKGGHDLVVNALRPEAAKPHLSAGAKWADSPKQVAEASEVVFTSLPTPPDVEGVALGDNGILAGLARGKAYFDLSTNSPTVVRRISKIFAERGVHMLDAPVSGGPRGAKSGKLAIWVGGDEEVFKRHKPVLDAMGDQATYIGPIGAGSIAKLVHNCAGYAVQTALAEVFAMGVKAGLEPLALWKAVRKGANGRQRLYDRLRDNFLQDKYEPPRCATAGSRRDGAIGGRACEERFTRLKNEAGYPRLAVAALLRELSLTPRDIDLVALAGTRAYARDWMNRVLHDADYAREYYGVRLEEPARGLGRRARKLGARLGLAERSRGKFDLTERERLALVTDHLGLERSLLVAYHHHLCPAAVGYYRTSVACQSAL